MTTHRKLAALLAADAAGYSRLMADDEAATLRSLNDARGLFRVRIEAHGGRLIDTAGDSILAEFPSAVEAVDCADEIQHELAKRNHQLAEHRRMQFRIGINLGDVIGQKDGTIYGDGVNVSARLQALAEPGGICISGTAFDQVEGKLPLQFKFIGEQQVKNIAKPVRAYRVLLDAPAGRPRQAQGSKRRGAIIAAGVAIAVILILGVLWNVQNRTKEHSSRLEDPALAMPSSSSIAVLPFTNMGGDPKEDYFSDGLTEDIITRLSHFRELFVIARNSTSRFKAKAVDVQQVGRELGVRYVLEGSVRRTADRMRVTAQLIDATTGGHVWAQTYDEPLRDVFTVQDEVTMRIVGSLGINIRDAEKQRVLRKSPEDLNAYDLVLRAGQLWAEASPTEHLQFRNLMERAVQLDPGYARAQAMLAFAYLDEFRWKYNPHPARPNALKSALERAELAARLDPSDAYTHYALGKISYYTKELDRAENEFGKAFELNPSFADAKADWGIRLAVMGRPRDGVALTREAMRLNPLHPGWYHFTLAADAMQQGEFARAVAESESIGLPQLFWTQVWLCTSYAYAGRMNEARAAAEKLLRLHPDIENDWGSQTSMHSWSPKFTALVTEGLRKAGMNLAVEKR